MLCCVFSCLFRLRTADCVNTADACDDHLLVDDASQLSADKSTAVQSLRGPAYYNRLKRIAIESKSFKY